MPHAYMVVRILCVVLSAAAAAGAQVSSGSIAGQVTDVTRAIIPGVAVTLVNQGTGAEPMLAPGPDGMVNTADDAEQEVLPGPDGELGTDDDVPLVGYTRQVTICDVDGNPDLRQIIVTIRFNGSNAFGERRREYRLVTLISRFS